MKSSEDNSFCSCIITKNDCGSIFVETAIVVPVLIMIFLFCTDFLAYTKSHTFIAQVARDNAIYFATVPDEPLPNQYTNLVSVGDGQHILYSSGGESCMEGDPSNPWCLHFITQLRTIRAIMADSKSLDMQSINITTRYDNAPGNETVTLSIRVKKKILFFFSGFGIEAKSVLRKVNL